MPSNKEKNFKIVSQENVKATQNQTILQEPNKRDKYQGWPQRKTLGTILEVGERRTQTNGLENKNIWDDA